jgi:membrane associated rhomboid family serine protease
MDEHRTHWMTTLLAALWVLVFVAMALQQGSLQSGTDIITGGIRADTAYLFGAVSTDALRAGEYARCLTATLVHLSLVHLIVNLIGLIHLGRMIESWYGPSGLLTIYVGTGFLGNLLACSLRPFLGVRTDIPSAGGSVVVCGLVGLVAVVGYRSRTRFGQFVFQQMLSVIVMTGLLGLVLPLDNLGHAAGAAFGALFGLAHRWLIRNSRSRLLRFAGVFSAATLVAATAWQSTLGWQSLAQRSFADQTPPGTSPSLHPDAAIAQWLEQNLAPYPVRLPPRMQEVDVIQAVEIVRELGRRGPIPWDTHDKLTGDPPARRSADRLRGRLLILARLIASSEGLTEPTPRAYLQPWRNLVGRSLLRAPTPGEVAAFDRQSARLILILERLSRIRKPPAAKPAATPPAAPDPDPNPNPASE